MALFSKSDQISASVNSLSLIQASPSVTNRMRYGARKPLCLPGGLQWPGAAVPDCPQPWCLGSCLAHLAHPKRGETAIASPCCANTSPLHPAANCTSQGGACNTFHHLYLLAGKMGHFIGPGTDIQTSKEILFVFGGGETLVWARKVDAALLLQILHGAARTCRDFLQ